MGRVVEMERMGLVAQVEAELEKMLALGLLPPDGKMPSEHGLARCFKVSRGTVREALRSLSAKGLLEQYPGRRTRVVEWDEALTLETLSVALTEEGRFRPGRMQLLEGFLALKRDITVELLVACAERATAAELEQLSQACYALADAARWDTGDGRWVQQEFALLRQAACMVNRIGHVLLIQSLERAFRGMAKWAVPHLDSGAVQAWAWHAMHALAEKNIQALRQELPPLLQVGDERLLSRLEPSRQPAVKSETHSTEAEPHSDGPAAPEALMGNVAEQAVREPPPTEARSHSGEPAASEALKGNVLHRAVREPHPTEAEGHSAEPAAADALKGGVSEQVVPDLSNNWAGLRDVPPAGAPPPEPVFVGATAEPEPLAPREDSPPIVHGNRECWSGASACPASEATPRASCASRRTTAHPCTALCCGSG